MKKTYIIYVMLMLVFTISASGCADSGQTESRAAISADEISMENLHTYTSQDLFDSVQFISLAESYDNGIYIYGSMTDDPYTGSVYYCDIEENTISRVDYDTDETTYLSAMEVASNGDLWLAKYIEPESDGAVQEGYRIDIVSNDSNAVTVFEHDDVPQYLPTELILNETDNKIYLYGIGGESEYIYVYNMQGEQLAEIELDNILKGVTFSEKDNKLYTLDSNNTVGVLNEESYSIEEVVQIEFAANCTTLYESDEYSFYIDLNSVLMGFDAETNDFTPLIDWISNGISGVVSHVMPHDEYCIGIYWDAVSNEDNIVKMSETSELQSDTEVLQLATLENNEFIKYAVASFNNQNNDYYIEIVDYSIYGDDALQKLNTEIISGDIPDLFDVNGLPVNEYIANGVLEDVDPYMRADLNLDDYWESALSAIYDGEKCYLVVPCFAIATIFANSDNVRSFSYSEMLTYIKENSKEVTYFSNEMVFIGYMVSCYADQFIDWGNNSCHFDSNEFIELLDTASSLTPLDENYNDFIMINKGQQSISFEWIYDIANIDLLAAVFNDNYSIINASSDKDEAGAIMAPLYSFGMSSSSDYKDGAWEFLEYLYSDDAQEIIKGTGISMKKSSLDTQLESFKETMEREEEYGTAGYTYVTDGEEYFIPFVNNRLDAYQKTLDLINSIDRLYQVDESIMEIIEEEIPSWLQGDKSAEEIASIIQNRASTYINEQS